jgi:hypothetical protein
MFRPIRQWFSRLIGGRSRVVTQEKPQPFFKAYGGQTVEELINLADDHRADSIVLAFEQAIEAKATRVGDDGLTDPEKVVLAVEAFERDVNNDGFDGFFRYRAEYVPVIVDALNAIDAGDAAEVARSAIAALGIGSPLTPAKVEAVMDREDDDALEVALNAADARYYGLALDLAGQVLDYIRANVDQIVLP